MTDTIYAWSQTAASNANADATINWAEYQNPSTANDSARAMMARLAELLADLAPTRASTGSANVYAVTTAAAGSSLRNGEQITFTPNHSNTAACTLNVDGRGAKPWRPKSGTEFVADNILSGVPVTAYYSLSDDAWYSAAGYYVSALASGVALQSITARLPQIGDLVVSMDSSPGAGRIRLQETTSAHLKTSYPEMNAWLFARGYPWGSTATHFNLPPAAGYVLRFAATSSSIDTGGARTAGSTQADGVLSHTHTVTVSGSTSTGGAHAHSESQAQGSIQVTRTSLDTSVFNSNSTVSTTTNGDHAHSVTASGTSAVNPSGTTENRVKNVAFHCDVIASTALAAAQVAVFGFPLQWDTGTTAVNPGAGRVRGNNATLNSITELYVSTEDGWGVSLSGILGGLTSGNVVFLSKVGAQANRLAFQVSGTPTAGTGFYTVPVTVDVAEATLSNSDQMALEYSYGATGPAGPVGPNTGLAYTWSTNTAGDPGAGKVLANNATLSSATAVNISKTGAASESLGTHLATWDDSTSTIKGHLRIFTLADRDEYIEADVTGITDNTTYYTVALSNVVGGNAPSSDDAMSVSFTPKGDKGDTGATGATGATGSTGATGATGPAWDAWEGAWLTATAYVANDAVENDGSSYICTSGHTSGASTEPGVGASWATVWDLIAAKGADGVGTGDVTAAGNFGTDNRVLRSDGTLKGAQASAVTIDDSGNVSGVVNQAMTGYLDLTEIAAPSSPSANVARIYAVDDSGTTKLAMKDSAGAVTTFGAGGGSVTPSMLRGYIGGLVLANNATDANNDIDVSAGCACADNQSAIMVLASTLTKRLDAAWAVGTGNGGLDTGAKAANTTYFLWLIQRSDTGVVDALFSASASSPTMPTSYDRKALIGAVITNGSSNIKAFTQIGDTFAWNASTLDYSTTTLDTTALTVTLNAATSPGVPIGIACEAQMEYAFSHASLSRFGRISSLLQSDQAPLSVGNTATVVCVAGATQVGQARVITNSSGQLRVDSSGASTTMQLTVIAWRMIRS